MKFITYLYNKLHDIIYKIHESALQALQRLLEELQSHSQTRLMMYSRQRCILVWETHGAGPYKAGFMDAPSSWGDLKFCKNSFIVKQLKWRSSGESRTST